MSTSSSTTRRHRMLAMTSVAIISAPLILGAVLKVSQAHAVAAPLEQSSAAARSFADIVAADKPAVVTITTRLKPEATSAEASPLGPNSPYDDFFRQFFGNDGPMQGMPHPRGGQIAEALGSGFIVSADGEIVTNNHVVDGATDIKVTLDDGQEFKATLVGHDAKTDLAVLRIDAGTSLPTVAWGDSDRLRAGDSVVAIGNPFGIGTTVTSGIVSARGRDLHNGPYDDFIQVDAAINHGNSGGPLVDSSGKVVGINTAIYSPNGGNVGVGFAIPSDQAEAVVARLVKGDTIEHGYIGVQIQPVTKDVAAAIGLANASGALVSQIVDDSPASRAGLKAGDVITAFGGKAVGSPRALSRLVADAAPGAKDEIAVWRNGKQIDLSITVARNGDEQQAAAESGKAALPATAKLAIPELGIGLAELTPDMRDAYGIDPSVHGGMVASVDPDKAAADGGIQQGDVVVSVNQQQAVTAADIVKAVRTAEKDGRKSVLLQVERGQDQMFVGLPLGSA